MAVTIAGHYRRPGLTVRLSARRTVTMHLADDDASAAWELLVSFREML
jgi:hypothetical protein